MKRFLLAVFAAVLILSFSFEAYCDTFLSINFRTELSPEGKITVVRQPPKYDFERSLLFEMPSYDPKSGNSFQVDLRGYDLSELDLKNRVNDLLHADFDSNTMWPKKMPAGFKPSEIMKLGKSPGFDLKKLHNGGITGKGVGIAIIDKTLLVDHSEYKGRLKMYEEIHCGDDAAQMHGSAVASIAVGKTVGVAPGADLYYIAETEGTFDSNSFIYDFTWLAKSIDRILEVNKTLPKKSKIRVISTSVGWSPEQKGYKEVTEAVERAKKEGIFVVSTSLFETYNNKYFFHGLGRDGLKDPEKFTSYGPGSWWAAKFYSNKTWHPTKEALLVPMDSRCTASPTGSNDYAFYSNGGWSWSVPYIAGLYALSCQVKPNITPDIFWSTALKTGNTIDIKKAGKSYKLGKIVNPTKLLDELK